MAARVALETEPNTEPRNPTPDARVALKQIDVGVASTINQLDVILLEGDAGVRCTVLGSWVRCWVLF